MLIRSQFDNGCKAFIAKYAQVNADSSVPTSLLGWTWYEPKTSSRHGYMARSVEVFQQLPAETETDIEEIVHGNELEDSDASVAPMYPRPPEILTCQQYVVFSATFRVPALYFVIYRASGVLLTLAEVVKTTFFKSNTCRGIDVSPFALSIPTSSFPLLSYGDHPTLGTPCWYFHPCETEKAVEELLCDITGIDWTEEGRLVRYIELWFMVLCSVVNL